MNNGQRAQLNFLEQFTYIIGVSVVAAMYTPYLWWSFGFLVAYFAGRFIFSVGYTRAGPNARIPCAIIMDIAIFA